MSLMMITAAILHVFLLTFCAFFFNFLLSSD